MMPSSRTATKPVHSPQPFNTAPPAGIGCRHGLPPRSSTVTPVRATPGPSGGGGSSRQIVAWPSPTPGTSSTELVGPAGNRPILIPKSAARTPPASRDEGELTMTLGLPVVIDDRCKRHQPLAEIWLGVRT